MSSSVVSPHVRAGFVRAESVAREHSATAQRVAGALLMLPGVGMVMGWVTAEALYPQSYSIHANSLSHLGATEPPNSVALQPSATFFDATMIVGGLMLLGAAYFTFRAFQAKRVSIPIALLGVGAVGVGIFALNVSPTVHTMVALLAFTSGGVTLVLASTIAPPFFRYLWMTLGVVALVAIALGLFFPDWAPIAALGVGGIERWNAYPIVLWMLSFGSLLLNGHPIGGFRHPDSNRITVA